MGNMQLREKFMSYVSSSIGEFGYIFGYTFEDEFPESDLHTRCCDVLLFLNRYGKVPLKTEHSHDDDICFYYFKDKDELDEFIDLLVSAFG